MAGKLTQEKVLAWFGDDEKEESDLDSFFDDESDAEIGDINQDSVELDHE
jgi:hypothetical protein